MMPGRLRDAVPLVRVLLRSVSYLLGRLRYPDSLVRVLLRSVS
jgi:hypothetical protein